MAAQLYLPAQHDDADLVLAGLIAELVDSAELYVTWTAAEGPATPAIPALLREPQVRPGTVLDARAARAVGRAAQPARRATTPPRVRRRAPARSARPRPLRPPPPSRASRRRRRRRGRRRRPRASGGLAPSRAHGSSNSTRHLPSSACCSASRARNDLPERPLKPVTGRAVRPVAISSFATAIGSVLPALLFQITNPQPGSSRDQHEKPLRFSTMSWPQTGHGPRLARGIRTSLSFASSSPTVPRGEVRDVAA